MNRRQEIKNEIATLEAERDTLPTPTVYMWVGDDAGYGTDNYEVPAHWVPVGHHWMRINPGQYLKRNHLFVLASAGDPGAITPETRIACVDSFEGLK